MIFSCNSLDLADALSKVSQALPQRATSPILMGIKIEAEGDFIKLTATDLEFTIVKKIKADVKMGGEVLVSGSVFSDFIKKTKSGTEVEISDEDGMLLVNYMDNKTNFATIPVEEYPVLKEYEYKYKITILQKDFKELVEKTAFASNSTDDNRPILKGCLLKVENDEIKSVALDGFRMAICKKQLVGEYPTTEINIPSKDLVRIAKLLENDDDAVDLCFSEKKLILELDDLKIISTPIEGFVNYEASIPKDFETVVTIKTDLLKDALERVSVFSKYEKSNLVKIEVKNNIINIVSNSENGSSSENIPVLAKGKDIVVGYNYKFIADCLKNIDDEYILIKMNYLNPSIITGVENSDYIYLILPVRFR